MPRVNLTGVKVGFDAFAQGKYPAVFSGFTNKKNKNREDMIAVEFTVDEDNDEYAGRKAWCNFNLNEKGFVYLKMFLLAIGATPEELDAGDLDTDEMLQEHDGAAVTIVCGTPGEYRGAATTNIVRVEPPVLAGAAW